MRSLIIALQFLTVFQVKKDMAAGPDDLSRSMAFFPLIGALQGALLFAASRIFAWVFPDSVSAGLILLILVLTNGGLHLDGFADTVDGLAGGGSREERLRIMRDSSVGAIGVVFLVLILLIKCLAIAEMPFEAKGGAIFLFPVIGRWAMVPMACWAPYARAEGGVGAAFASNRWTTLAVSTVIALALSALAFGYLSVLFVLAIAVFVYLVTAFFRRKLGGVTGDVFGFQSEAAEALFLLMALGAANLFASNS